MSITVHEAAFQHAPLGILVRDHEGRVVDANPQFCELLGYSRDEILAMPFIDFPPPEDALKSWESYQDLIKGLTKTARFERRYIHKNGSTVYARVTVSAVRDEHGEFLYGLSMVEDVSHEHVSRMIQQSMQMLYEGGVLGFLEGVIGGEVIKCNLSMAVLLGVRQLAPGVAWYDLPVGTDKSLWQRKTAELYLRKKVPPFEVTFQSVHGQTPVLFGAVMTGDQTYQAFVLDLSASREAQDLRAKYQTLEWFTRAASHDLQEPLRKIRAFGEILQGRYGESLDAAGQQYLDYMVNGAVRLSTLLDDLLLYSRTGGPAQLEWHSLTLLTQEALVNINTEHADIYVDPWMPEVFVDRSQFVMILQNLLSNAIKYRRGERAQVRVVATSNGCEVRDQGIGFDPADADRMFEPFCRLAGKQFQGTGLGLAISRRLILAHGGTVTAQSIKGEGSTFRVVLPQASVREATQLAAA
jgi:PAS domain S-box-containing protein